MDGSSKSAIAKIELLGALDAELRRQLEETKAASLDAAAYATDVESRAESKWDTQGLEASYLAAGQASHARELAADMETLDQYRKVLLAPQDSVGVGAFVICDVDGSIDRYYLVPIAGGHDLVVGKVTVTTISLLTPIGRALRGKQAGADFQLPNGMTGRIVEVA